MPPTPRRTKRPTMPAWAVPTRTTEFIMRGRRVGAGTEVHLNGRSGRYRIVALCATVDRTWLEVRGPVGRQVSRLHAVPIEKVTVIHRTRSETR